MASRSRQTNDSVFVSTSSAAFVRQHLVGLRSALTRFVSVGGVKRAELVQHGDVHD